MSIKELIARAVGCIDADRCNGRMEPGTCEGCVENAAAALAALESSGYAVVPAEPTEAMLLAALTEVPTKPPETVDDEILHTYRAMLQAHKGDG